MALNKRIGPFDEKSFARAAAPYRFRFLAANPVVQASILQDEGLVVTVTRMALGTFVVALRSRFMRIMPAGQSIRLTGNFDVKVVALVEGLAAANTITYEVNNIGTALADGNAIVDCAVGLISSLGS